MSEIAEGRHRFETPGVIYRTAGGSIVENPRRMLDLRDVPSRTRDAVDNRRYFLSTPYVGVQTKRGCPLLCSYCMDPITYGRKTQGRMRTPTQVADEFENLASSGIRNVWMADPEFNLPPQHAIEVTEELARRKTGVTWYCGMRPVTNTVPDRLVRALRDADCREVMLTIDSVSEKVARRNGVGGQTKESVLEATTNLRRYGYPIVLVCLVGLPGQGAEELIETLDFIASIRPHLAFFATSVRIYPGTPMEEMALEEGIIQPGWNPLEDVYYRPEFVETTLVPILRRYAAREPDWILLTENNHVGEVREKMVNELGVRGSNYEAYRYLKEHRAWLTANVVGFKLRSALKTTTESLRRRLRVAQL